MRSATRKKTGKDPEYLAFIRAQPCVVCMLPWKVNMTGVSYSNVQKSPTEAAHIGPRGLSRKVPDRAALPMCGEHHRWLHVVGPKQFWAAHKLNPMELILSFNERFDGGERAE